MVLVTGGCASGKRTFALSQGFEADDIADGVLDERPVVWHAEELATVWEGSLSELADLLAAKELVLIREMGCGPHPVHAEDREERERVGRLAVALAERATTVVRMVCGIPCVLKGSLDE